MGYIQREPYFDELIKDGCPLSADNNLTTDTRFIEVTSKIGLSYLDILKENNIDKILMSTLEFKQDLLEFNNLIDMGIYYKPVITLKEECQPTI